jgi:hypothetical protein
VAAIDDAVAANAAAKAPPAPPSAPATNAPAAPPSPAPVTDTPPAPAAAESGGLETMGFKPPPGTRQIPEGIPDSWRIRSTDSPGGVRYYDPQNPGNAVRVMPGSAASPYPTSQAPYVRWQLNGQPLDVNGNVLPTAKTPDAHIPLQNFQFNPALFP